MLDAGAIGALRHVVVNWHVESRAIQMRMRNWKTLGGDGGGVLGNFISHCFHYLEWFCGPIAGLSARISRPAGRRRTGNHGGDGAAIPSRPAGQPVDELRVLSRRRPPHRILRRGRHAGAAQSRPPTTCAASNCFTPSAQAPSLERIAVIDPVDAQYPDGRIAPVSRLAKKFFDAIENGGTRTPGFAEGYRVQRLIDAARRSHQQGAWIDVARADASRETRVMSGAKILVTGGTGFIGSGLVKALAARRHARARARRQFARQPAPARRCRQGHRIHRRRYPRCRSGRSAPPQGMDEVHHLAFVNGTEFFYSAARSGARCRRARHDQRDRRLPQAQRRHARARLEFRGLSDAAADPDRRKRAAGRARPAKPALFLRRRQVDQRSDGDQFRPQIFRARADLPPAQCLRPRHGLGARHPAIRAAPATRAAKQQPSGRLRFEIQGTGQETRSFCFIDDLVAGVMVMREKGEHLGIYHVGTTEEVAIAELARRIAGHAGREIELVAGKPARRRHAAPLPRHFETRQARL